MQKRMDEDLIKRFVELHSEAEKLLEQQKVTDAKQKYSQVLDAYHAIDKSALESYHKELAYDQVTTLFKKVNDAKERIRIPVNLIIAALLVVGFSLIVFLSPSIVGLISLEDLARQPVNISITESGIRQVTLRDRPLSLSASGEYEGTAKLYFKEGNKLELIFDTSAGSNGTFTDACVDTCEITADSNVVELFASVEPGSSVRINEVSYKVERKTNTAPIWKGTARSFKASVGKPTTIDLNDYFSDAEKDPLVFLSTTDTGLSVMVQDSQVTLTPETPGTKNIIFIASDLLEVSRMQVTIEAE